MSSIFTKIINGEIPAYKIAENDKFIAFLDIMPMVKGHTLVVPKIETDKVFDLEDEYLAEMLVFAKPIAKSLEANFDCKRVGIATLGLEVPHCHLHLVPINSFDDLNFGRKKLTVPASEMQEIQQRILKGIGKL